MLSSFVVMHSFLWSQPCQIINRTRSADDGNKFCQIPRETLSGMLLRGFRDPPHAGVINRAGESWVWPHSHLWGQEVRDTLLGQGLLAALDNIVISSNPGCFGHNSSRTKQNKPFNLNFQKWQSLWKVWESVFKCSATRVAASKTKSVFFDWKQELSIKSPNCFDLVLEVSRSTEHWLSGQISRLLNDQGFPYLIKFQNNYWMDLVV